MEVQRLYVGGLYPEITEAELKERFSKFGVIDNVQIKVKKGFEESSVKAFAHLDLKAQESDIKRCIKTFDKTKWKGHELKIDRAKENFLSRLMKERNSPKECTEGSTVAEKKPLPFEKDVRGPPGTTVPGEENWVVGKYGRILPVVNLKKEGSSFTKKIDPSKYVHKVKKLGKDDDTNDMVDINPDHLTWHLDDNENEVTKKRKGEFKEWKPKAKQRKSDLNYSLEDVLKKSSDKYIFHDKDQSDSEDVEFEVVDLEGRDMPEKSSFESSSLDLSRFESDSDSDSGIGGTNGNIYLTELKNKRRISEPSFIHKQTLSNQVSSGQGNTRRSVGTLKEFKGTRGLSKSSEIQYVHSKNAKSLKNINDDSVNKIVGITRDNDNLGPEKRNNLKNAKSIKTSTKPEKVLVNMGTFNNLNEFSSGFSADLDLNKLSHVSSESDEDNYRGEEKHDSESETDREEGLEVTRAEMQIGKSAGPKHKDHARRVNTENLIKNIPDTELSLSLNSKLTKPVKKIGKESSDSDSSDSDDDSDDSTNKRVGKGQTDKSYATKSSNIDIRRDAGDDHVEDDDESDDSADESEDAVDNEADYEGDVRKGNDKSYGSRNGDSKIDSSSKLKAKYNIANSESDSSSSDEDVSPSRAIASAYVDEDRNAVIPHGNGLKSANTDKVPSSAFEVAKTKSDDAREDKKLQKSEEVERHRLEAVKQKHQESRKQIAAVQKALSNVKKGTALNKKIVFDDDSDDGRVSPLLKKAEPNKRLEFDSSDDESDDDDADDVNGATKADTKDDEATSKDKKPALFDSSSSDDEGGDSGDDSDENRFAIKPQFEGPSGSKLLELQTTYGNDKRFQLDKRFVESSEGETDEDMKEGDEEKRNAMKILEQVVGFKVNKGKQKKDENSNNTFKDVSSLHYDPTRAEHKELELIKEKVPKKSKLQVEKQKRLKEIAAISSQYSGDLTMERFVEVSDSFKDAFGKKSDEEENQTFSLLKAFGRQGPDEEEEEEKEENATPNDATEMKLGERFDGNNEVDIDKEEEPMDTREADLDAGDIVTVGKEKDEKTRQKKIKKHRTFFFKENDNRLKIGLKFYRTEELETIREHWKKDKQNYIQQYKGKAKNFQRKMKKQTGKRVDNNSQRPGQKSRPFDKKSR